MERRGNKTYHIAILGMLTAIILIQNFVPIMGYIPIPPLNPTIIHITVIIAALTLGTKDGMILGGIWGIACIVRALTFPTTPLDLLLFTNPIIAIIPRILVGFIAGYSYKILRTTKLNDFTSMVISAVLGSLTNTFLVLFFIYIFYGQAYADFIKVDSSNLLAVMGTVVATIGLAEAVIAAFIAPVIAKSLKHFVLP
ncbi:ECF transporter S component [Carnobacterium gallinarum]|uniref:ECF transporter S component n=1 Tax=Carnobacterium gallinarum TaxID=2749 RepID=UPI00054D3CAF|nr:ECF transporter S component [Carnobacterium gallinarum]